MAIIVNRDENRTELQKRIAKELTDKAKKKKAEPADMPDGVEDSAYVKDTKETTGWAWLWVLLAIAGVIALVYYFIVSSNQSQIPL
jgi:hypothetical protein